MASTPLPRGLATLTVGKIATNTVLRSPYVFLTPIAAHLHTTVGHLGFLLGSAELVGLSTAFIGKGLDRGRYRFWIATGACSTAAGAFAMAALHTPLGFAVGFVFAALGVALYTTSTHAWLGRSVPYAQRGRAIGMYETSWSAALLVGVPAVGALLSLSRWWSPYALLGALCMILAVVVRRAMPVTVPMPVRVVRDDAANAASGSVSCRRVVLVLLSSFSITFAAVSVFAVYGSWLQDRFGLSTRTLGVFSISIGVAELVASSASARYTDRWGKAVAVRRGALVMAVGIIGVLSASGARLVAVSALVVVFLGFEFAFVSQLSIVSEVGATRAGAVLAVDHALSTMSRASAAAAATGLYDARGIGPPALVALGCVLLCLTSVTTIGAQERSSNRFRAHADEQ